MVHALVVDDDIRAAETVRRMLVSDGWAVTVAFDGPDGLWRATEGSYDVIVLDIMMPGMNGYRVLQSLREREIWTPVMMLSAKDGEYDQAEALDCGADDYLVKPFSVVVLKARLRALVRRGAPERPVTLCAGDLSLDPAEHLVRRGDTPIPLTPREYAVLECLIRHAGTVVSKADILHSVWDENYEGDPNIIEVYIAYLRKRIDQPFGVRSIRTVRGVGYRIG
ncbi:DNA-binding response regulator [Gordonia sp. CNJ-863]|jgi:two-component system OmpR family response regulator|uniref:Transcriptional regulator n=2 Tax=Gordonia alkanivorans TaxID=84096 RepID=W9DEZ1_9ACTN|nr:MULTISPECIES: response regulator transcription factor [Gordonia]ETA06939.1 transcriptional regulator [Gordonia alkanivorans CGMCC 6845]MDH3021487.1 response regulator transcription factor [Gordonia alkanivorans]MDH3025292.1 response regulator transcription factor [Gordonia alkanivorans]MDH3047667.1 response regulator transcription factor [Gordonia alkanivorans]MDH3051017.1 response regulator transcription factor [Gordonia alkanivorans]